MPSRALTAREHRVLVAGAVAICLMVGTTKGLPAWRRWHAQTAASAEESTAALARASAAVAGRRVLRDTLRSRRDRLVALAPMLLAGDSPAAAAASLAGVLSDAAADAGVQLGAVQLRTDTAHAGVFTRVSVRANATGDVRGITELLQVVERGPTLLKVRELAITQPEPAAGADRPEALRLEIVVEGLVQTPPSESRRTK